MTKQIERAYRRNKRRSWLLVAAVVAIAAVAIPFASGTGGGGKYYTLGSDTTVCVDDSSVPVTLALSNKASTQSLGSANITFPPYVTVKSTSKGTFLNNVVKLRSLSLPAKTGSVTFTVTIDVSGTGASALAAIVKQSNEFNDDDGGANLFTLLSGTSLPTLTAVNCTIEGKVWLDTDESGAQNGAEPGQPFDVYLYKKAGASYVENKHVSAGGSGAYTLTGVRLGQDYLVCERPPSGWSQTTPPASLPPCDTTVGNQANGYSLAGFAGSVTGKDFGNVPAVALTEAQGCGSSNFGGGTTIITPTFEYEARLSLPAGVCKSGSLVMFTYQSGSSRVATLHPPGNTVGTKYPVVERIKWTGVGPAQNPITLYYDDVFPYDGFDKQLMPMCTSDPRPNPTSDPFVLGANPSSVLPGTDTSCMIVSTDSAGGTYEAYVYSAVDGYKSTG